MSRTFRAASRITESIVGTARIEITRAGIEITTVTHETSVVKDEVSTADRRVRMWLVTAMNYVVPSKVLNVEKLGKLRGRNKVGASQMAAALARESANSFHG